MITDLNLRLRSDAYLPQMPKDMERSVLLHSNVSIFWANNQTHSFLHRLSPRVLIRSILLIFIDKSTSCALQIIQLVEGKASAYVFASPGCKKWDTCATEAILHAVGGNATFLFVFYSVLFHNTSRLKQWYVIKLICWLPQRKADGHARERLPIRRRCEAHELSWCVSHTKGSSVLRQQSSPVRPQGPAVQLKNVTALWTSSCLSGFPNH